MSDGTTATTTATAVVEPATPDAWVKVCPLDRLHRGCGAAARVVDRQIALFRITAAHLDGDHDAVYALDNRDPFSGAHVMARGIVGDAAGVLKVASPVYKQSFDLRTGACLDDDTVRLASYPVAIDDDGWVSVAVPAP
jgi:nitrite reductase (NADH) small subunit